MKTYGNSKLQSDTGLGRTISRAALGAQFSEMVWTLALVAQALVMLGSATSAAATVCLGELVVPVVGCGPELSLFMEVLAATRVLPL